MYINAVGLYIIGDITVPDSFITLISASEIEKECSINSWA